MKLFIDTNVVVDFLGKREPFFENAAIIFEMVRQGKIEAIVSSLTIVNYVEDNPNEISLSLASSPKNELAEE